jgi:CRISPR system Cascade subunit CasB
MSADTPLEDRSGIAWDWWRDLNPPEDSRKQGDRAALALLRRAVEPRQIWLVEAYDDLRRRLRGGRDDDDRVAILAHVLAHVREEPRPSRRFAAALGARPEGGTDERDHLMSPLRFKRLIEAATPVDRMREYRRAIRLLGNRANVRDLARSILAWNDQTRRRWSFDYFGASFADPETTAAGAPSAIADQQPAPEATP